METVAGKQGEMDDRRQGRRGRALWVALGFFFLLFAGCEQKIPKAGTSEGRLYIEKCGVCHPAPHPQKYTFKAWQRLVTTMEEKVETTGVREVLTGEEETVIRSYLKRHAKKIF